MIDNKTLDNIYQSLYNGDYEVIQVNKSKVQFTRSDLFKQRKKTRRSKKKAMSEAVNYLLYAYCVANDTDIYKNYVANVFVPKNPPILDFSNITLNDVISLVSPETTKTA